MYVRCPKISAKLNLIFMPVIRIDILYSRIGKVYYVVAKSGDEIRQLILDFWGFLNTSDASL
jgi:hypothetical protein